MGKVKITLVKSTIGQRPAVRRAAKSLKLGKINSSASFDRNPSLEGQIRVVQHLVKVEEV